MAGVAHQRNFLVAHHFGRLDPPVTEERLADGAGCLILEPAGHAAGRGAPARGRLLALEIAYHPHDPFEHAPAYAELMDERPLPGGEMGSASLPATLARLGGGIHRHRVTSRDGIVASSTWRIG